MIGEQIADFARTWLRVMAVAVAVALILAVSDGFGSGGLAILPRVIYWLTLTAAGALMGAFVGRRLASRGWFSRNLWLAAAAVALVITPPMALLVWGLNALIRHTPLTLSVLVGGVLPGTLATSAAITALAMLVRERSPMETHAAKPDAPPPRFLERLPARLSGAEIWAVEAQDHYLRLHTSLGRDMILMRLTDAIAELEGVEGARTHRSWWVARAAVASVERGDGRATLTLVDGQEAPVSRAYLSSLRAAGWF